MASMYTSIVVGIDGSPTAAKALDRAIELARISSAKLHVVSAYEPAHARVAGAPSGEAFQVSESFKVDAVLERALDRAGAAGLSIEQHAPRGDPADGLIGIANETGSDLIVIGSVGMQGPKRVFGSVPNTVSHKSACDVLIVQTAGG
jgi:nucleotide-binding universal stress UspA family protein